MNVAKYFPSDLITFVPELFAEKYYRKERRKSDARNKKGSETKQMQSKREREINVRALEKRKLKIIVGEMS